MVVESCGGRVHRGFLPGDPKEGKFNTDGEEGTQA